MDEAQEAANSAQKFIVAKHRFELATKHFDCMVCFFEGDHDKDYYKTHIRTICGEIIDIPCHCKNHVLKMYNEIHESYKDKYRLAYFIDRDFDELQNNPDIFETDGYSIENYYCSREAFSRYITDYLHVDQDSDDYNRSMQFYETEYNKAHDVVGDFNYYYSAIKRKERNGEGEYKIKAGESFPVELGILDVDKYNKLYSIDTLNTKFETSVSKDEISFEKNLLDKNPCLLYRGKYELQQLENMLTYLIKEAAGQRGVDKKKRVLQKNPKINCIQSGQLLVVLSSMADVTVNLRNYLNRFVKQ